MKPRTPKKQRQPAPSNWRDYERLKPSQYEAMEHERYMRACIRAAKKARV